MAEGNTCIERRICRGGSRKIARAQANDEGPTRMRGLANDPVAGPPKINKIIQKVYINLVSI